MFSWIVDAIWGAITTVGEWLLSLLVWLLEFLYGLVADLVNFLGALIGGLVSAGLSHAAAMLPGGWEITIRASFEFIGYIDAWVPVSYASGLLILFYSIKTALLGVKWVLKAIPGVWG